MPIRGLIRRAVVLIAALAVLHLGGARACTSVLSGTSPVAGGWSVPAALAGAAYIVAYLGTVVIAPILLIAAGLLAAWPAPGSRRPCAAGSPVVDPDNARPPRRSSDGPVCS